MIENVSKGSSSHLRMTQIDNSPLKNTNNQAEIQLIPQPENIEKGQVLEVIKSLNDFIQPAHTSLKFEFHEKLGEYYVTIRDDVTNEVIKEVPSKKMLDMYAQMAEYLGFMVDRRI